MLIEILLCDTDDLPEIPTEVSRIITDSPNLISALLNINETSSIGILEKSTKILLSILIHSPAQTRKTLEDTARRQGLLLRHLTLVVPVEEHSIWPVQHAYSQQLVVELTRSNFDTHCVMDQIFPISFLKHYTRSPPFPIPSIMHLYGPVFLKSLLPLVVYPLVFQIAITLTDRLTD